MYIDKGIVGENYSLYHEKGRGPQGYVPFQRRGEVPDKKQEGEPERFSASKGGV